MNAAAAPAVAPASLACYDQQPDTVEMTSITPFLMFTGDANDAIRFYVGLFPDSEVKSISRYEGGEMDGKVEQARIALKGQELMVIDSPIAHEFTFTPAVSLFVTCDTEEQIDNIFSKLAEGGKTLMALGQYPFARKFGWVNDRWGVSWQVSLPNA